MSDVNVNDEIKTRIAWLYHVEGMTQDEVANLVGMNRSRVLRILAAARQDGTVQIRVTTNLTKCIELERALEERFVELRGMPQRDAGRDSGPPAARVQRGPRDVAGPDHPVHEARLMLLHQLRHLHQRLRLVMMEHVAGVGDSRELGAGDQGVLPPLATISPP